MASTLKIRGGDSATVGAITPAARELLVNTDTDRVHVGDGSTVGGNPLALLSDVTSSTGTTNLSGSGTASVYTIASDTGTDATIPAATTSAAGVMTAADKTSLDALVAANGSTDLALANVTASTVDVTSSNGTDATITAATNAAAGVATAAQITELEAIRTVIGGVAGDTDLSTFTGVTIPDNPSVKSAIQILETELESQYLLVTNTISTVDSKRDVVLLVISNTSGVNVQVNLPISTRIGQRVKIVDSIKNASNTRISIYSLVSASRISQIDHNGGYVEFLWNGAEWELIDSSKEARIGTFSEMGVNNGYMDSCLFFPETTNPIILQKMGALEWWGISLPSAQHYLPRYAKTYIQSAVTNSSSGTLTGAWVTGVSATSFSGNYQYSLTANDTASFTTSGGQYVGIYTFQVTNAGYAKVSIDGSTTAANLLPTAQQEVDAGRLDSTALVANGGSLNPTDRVYNGYFAGTRPGQAVLFADNLADSAHTVLLTVTGYKQAAALDVRVYVEGWIESSESGTYFSDYRPIIADSISEWVHAIECKPTTGGSNTYIGGAHGNETISSTSWTVDGLEVTPTAWQRTFGNSVKLVRESNFFHPDYLSGATKVADNTTIISTGNSGIDIYDKIEWDIAMDHNTYYPAMMPIENEFDTFLNSAGKLETINSDDGSANLTGISTWVAGKNPANGLCALLEIKNPSTTVLNFKEVINDWPTRVEDRTGGAINKIYIYRHQGTSSQAGDVHHLYSSRKFAYNLF